MKQIDSKDETLISNVDLHSKKTKTYFCSGLFTAFFFNVKSTKTALTVLLLTLTMNLISQIRNVPFYEDFSTNLTTGLTEKTSNVWADNPGWTRWNGAIDDQLTPFRIDNAQFKACYDAWGLRTPYINDSTHENAQSAHVIISEDFKRWLISPPFYGKNQIINLSFEVAMTRDYRAEAGRPNESDIFAVLLSTSEPSQLKNDFKILRKWHLTDFTQKDNLNEITHTGISVMMSFTLMDYTDAFWIAFYAGRDVNDSSVVWFFLDNIRLNADVIPSTKDEISSIILSYAYPNPVKTTAMFDVMVSGNETADFKIFNIKGQLIKEVNSLKAGNQRIIWDKKDKTGREVANGVYFYQLNTSANTVTKKMVLVK